MEQNCRYAQQDTLPEDNRKGLSKQVQRREKQKLRDVNSNNSTSDKARKTYAHNLCRNLCLYFVPLHMRTYNKDIITLHVH